MTNDTTKDTLTHVTAELAAMARDHELEEEACALADALSRTRRLHILVSDVWAERARARARAI